MDDFIIENRILVRYIGKSKDLNKFKDHLALLPEDAVKAFSRIKYLPEKARMQRIIRYAILAANSLIKNNNEIILKLC